MERNFLGTFGVLTLMGLIFQPAFADDQKSAGRGQERHETILVVQKHAVAAPPERGSLLVIEPSQGRPQALAGSRSSGDGEKEEQEHQHKSLTLFHFNSRFGEVAVKPVIGHVTGAEFSIDF